MDENLLDHPIPINYAGAFPNCNEDFAKLEQKQVAIEHLLVAMHQSFKSTDELIPKSDQLEGLADKFFSGLHNELDPEKGFLDACIKIVSIFAKTYCPGYLTTHPANSSNVLLIDSSFPLAGFDVGHLASLFAPLTKKDIEHTNIASKFLQVGGYYPAKSTEKNIVVLCNVGPTNRLIIVADNDHSYPLRELPGPEL